MEHYQTIWNNIKQSRTLSNILEHYQTFGNIIRHLKQYQAFWIIIKHFGTLSNILEHYQTMWNNITRSGTLTNTLQRSNILQHCQTFYYIYTIFFTVHKIGHFSQNNFSKFSQISTLLILFYYTPPNVRINVNEINFACN